MSRSWAQRGTHSAGRGGGGGGRGRGQLVIWSDDETTFRIEQEAMGITDDKVGGWLKALGSELSEWKGKVVCSSINLSRNELGDYGVQEIMNFLIDLRIPVQMIKLYKNWIADDGLRAIGSFIKQTPEPVVQEIHLSHNLITQDGALAIFQAVKDSKKYPCNRGKDCSPLWLRMENNNIAWDPVVEKLRERDFHWTCGDTRDAWRREPGANERGCPMVSMHRSYHHQVQGHGNEDVETWQRKDRKNQDDGDADWPEEERPKRTMTPPVERRERRDRGERPEWRREREQESGEADYSRDEAWEDDHSVAASGSAHAAGSAHGRGAREPRRQAGGRTWDRQWDETRPAASDEGADHDDIATEIQAVKQFVEAKLEQAAEGQSKKFNLIFSILHELQDKHVKLETTMRDFMQHYQVQQQQHQQATPVQAQQSPVQYAVQMVPVDGMNAGGDAQQNWSGNQHQFGSGVW